MRARREEHFDAAEEVLPSDLHLSQREVLRRLEPTHLSQQRQSHSLPERHEHHRLDDGELVQGAERRQFVLHAHVEPHEHVQCDDLRDVDDEHDVGIRIVRAHDSLLVDAERAEHQLRERADRSQNRVLKRAVLEVIEILRVRLHGLEETEGTRPRLWTLVLHPLNKSEAEEKKRGGHM